MHRICIRIPIAQTQTQHHTSLIAHHNTHHKLKLKRKTSILDASLEMARLFILRARKNIKGREDQDKGAENGGSGSGDGVVDINKSNGGGGTEGSEGGEGDLLGISASDGDSSVTGIQH
jgi:hypothetical protein